MTLAAAGAGGEMPPAPSGLHALLLGLVTWATVPGLSHFEGALIPWPAHAFIVAAILSAPRARRVRATLLATAALFAASLANALATGGFVVQAFPATALLVAEAVAIVLLYDRLSGDAAPLSSTTAYAWLLFASVVAPLPFVAVAEVVLRLRGGVAVEYSGYAFWIAAVTANWALTGALLSLYQRAPAGGHRAGESLEFVALVGSQAAALLSAFFFFGPFGGLVPPAAAALPFLAWGGIRFGLRGYSLVSALLVLAVVGSTWLDIGPFTTQLDFDDAERFRRAWVYVASLVGPGMLFPVAIAERREAERRTTAALAQLRAILEGTTDLIAAVDRNLVLVAANPSWLASFERITGRRLEPGTQLTEAYAALPTADRDAAIERWRQAISGRSFESVQEIGDPARVREEFEITYSPVRDERGDVVGASQVVRNLSERRRREAEEAQARRLETVGRLAGGVAHDFNNLMTAIMAYTELVVATLPPDDPRRGDLGQIDQAASRAGELTQQLLAFARQRPIQPRLVDPSELVHGFAALLAPLLGPTVRLAIDAPSGLHRVRLDPRQFEQVLMNLAVNARDAMPDGGDLTIQVADEVRDGIAGVRLSVRDSGSGMPPEVEHRIFDPFFTTKGLGGGTGLGLSTVHGIVMQAGGRIRVETATGAGTTFHIFFPAADGATPAPSAPPPPAPRTP